MPHIANLEIALDLSTAQRSAERVRTMLQDLRARHDLARFEYTRQVRIAPMEIPHSHPVLTLNTWVRDETGLLCGYLHEQMHWYLTWYSHAHPARWRTLYQALLARYPDAPTAPPAGAPDRFSTYLHLVINWLEVDAVACLLDRDTVIRHVSALPFYAWMYRTVIADWKALGALYTDHAVIPLRPATSMSAEDLRLAATVDDGAPIDAG